MVQYLMIIKAQLWPNFPNWAQTLTWALPKSPFNYYSAYTCSWIAQSQKPNIEAQIKAQTKLGFSHKMTIRAKFSYLTH